MAKAVKIGAGQMSPKEEKYKARSLDGVSPWYESEREDSVSL